MQALCVPATAAGIVALASIILLMIPAKIELKLMIGDAAAKAYLRASLAFGTISFCKGEAVKLDGEKGLVFCEPKSVRYGKSVFDKTAYKRKKRRRYKQSYKAAARLLAAAARSIGIKELHAEGRLGIKDHADKTALILGSVNSLAAAAACLLPCAGKSIDIVPVFDRSVLNIDAACILKLSSGKLIINAIKLKRRSK